MLPMDWERRSESQADAGRDGPDRHALRKRDVELSPEEEAVARPISITHAQLQELGRPLGDYLYAAEQK